MNKEKILDNISRGRTDFVFHLLNLPEWKAILNETSPNPLHWFVYYNDVTAIKAVLNAGGDLSSLNLDSELGNAAFFGHWKVVDFLISQGANVNFALPTSGETPLHNAFCKAGRPYFLYVVKLLIENGANVNAKTIPHAETGGFMRDVRTKGETPLHRAAAYSDAETIKYLIDNGADKTAQDIHGNSPLTWASEHLRPGAILQLLTFPPHTINPAGASRITSDHGCGWGNGMERNFLGDLISENSTDGLD